MAYNKESSRKWYLKNKEKKIAQAREWEKNNPDKVKNYRTSIETRKRNNKCLKEGKARWKDQINNIKKHYGCQNKNCLMIGEFMAEELDFHHLNTNEKEYDIAEIKNNIKRTIKEINKCCVLCSNCHRRHHAGLLIEIIGKCNINNQLEIILI